MARKRCRVKTVVMFGCLTDKDPARKGRCTAVEQRRVEKQTVQTASKHGFFQAAHKVRDGYQTRKCSL